MKLALISAIVLPVFAWPDFVIADSINDHAVEVGTFAGIMADIRTADEQCPDLAVDQARVAAEKDRLHIADADYFAFRKKARDRADEIEAKLISEDAIKTWCAATYLRYGPQGTLLAGALHR